MEVIRVLTIHRAPTIRHRLRQLLEVEADVDLVGELAYTANAVPFIRECQPQLIFLEALFENEHVVPTLENISETAPPLLVFISARDEYAVRAFEASALDYLPESFTEDRFLQTLARAREQLQKQQIIASTDRLLHLLQNYVTTERTADPAPSAPPYEERLVIKSGSRLLFLDIEEVDWIEAEGVYVRIHVGAKSHLLRESLQNVEARLDPRQFIRIHRSTVVNVRRIKEITPHTSGGAVVLLRDGSRLKLSRSYRNRLNAMLG